MLRIGVQVITRQELERAARRGRRVHAVCVGWTHLSRGISRELREQALGRVVTLGVRSGF